MLGPEEKRFLTKNSVNETLLQLNLSHIIPETYLIFKGPVSEGKLVSLENYRRERVFDTPVSTSPEVFTCRAEYQILLVRNV
jgi:hypothetical protein